METKLTRKIEVDSQIESRMTDKKGKVEGGGIKEKGLMDMDNSVAIAGCRVV